MLNTDAASMSSSTSPIELIGYAHLGSLSVLCNEKRSPLRLIVVMGFGPLARVTVARSDQQLRSKWISMEKPDRD